MRKTVSTNNGLQYQPGGQQRQHFNQFYPTSGSTPALNNAALNDIYSKADQQNRNNRPFPQHTDSPAYYYSSTLDKTKPRPPQEKEQFHTTTTTLRSNKTLPESPIKMDYKANPAGAFGRRHTATGTHEFASPYMPAPSYNVEHLASFAAGKQFGLTSPNDGVRKLKQMGKNSAICAVPMVFTLNPDRISVLDENGTLVEEFPLALVADPTAHISSDPNDLFNNVLLFVVSEHDMPRNVTAAGVVPTEMHIFQCIGISAQAVAEDLHHYTKGQFHKVRPGHRSVSTSNLVGQTPFPTSHGQQYRDDDISVDSNGTEYFEMDVNTLNRCFDDIERFVARIQSAAIAQRELETQQYRSSKKKANKRNASQATQNSILQLRAQLPTFAEFTDTFQKFKLCFNLLAKLKNHIHEPNAPELCHFLFTPLIVILDACQWGLGQQVAQQVFSPLLSFDALDLLRTYLFPKEREVWQALGRAWSTAPEDWDGPLPPPYRPVFADGFAPFGHHPSTPLEVRMPPPTTRWDAFSALHPQRYNSAPAPIHRGVSAPTARSSLNEPAAYNGHGLGHHKQQNSQNLSSSNTRIENIELERINLEKERLEFERRKMLERERELFEHEKKLKEEAERLEQERRRLQGETERRSIAESDRPDFYRSATSIHTSPKLDRRAGSIQMLTSNGKHHHHTGNNGAGNSQETVVNTAKPAVINSTLVEQNSPRQKAFLLDLSRRGCKIVQVTYDRNACNSKELTVTRGEYLEVLNDARNWWECRNVHSRTGFVPHTILTVLSLDDELDGSGPLNEAIPPAANKGRATISANSLESTAGSTFSHQQPSLSGSSTPEVVRQRRGAKGEFRYF